MKLILTSNGFENQKIAECFIQLLRVPAKKASVLFIPTAAIDADAKQVLPKCYRELVDAGIAPDNIVNYDCDKRIPDQDLGRYDAVYVAGGSTKYLFEKMKAVGFDQQLKRLLGLGAVYVGASAGSIVACKPYLSIVKKHISVHSQKGHAGKLPSFFPIRIKNFQALIVIDGNLELLG